MSYCGHWFRLFNRSWRMKHHHSRCQHQVDIISCTKKSYPIPLPSWELLDSTEVIVQCNYSNHTFEEPEKWSLHESKEPAYPLKAWAELSLCVLLVHLTQWNMIVLQSPSINVSSNPVSNYSWNVCIPLSPWYTVQIIFTFPFNEDLWSHYHISLACCSVFLPDDHDNPNNYHKENVIQGNTI